MRLLHVVSSYLPATRYGGTIASVHGLCRALAARGHDVHVYTTSVDGPVDSPVRHGEPVDVEGVKVWYFQSNTLRRLYYAPALAGALRQSVSEFAVVHTHAIYLWPLWAAAREAGRAGVPYVVSLRGMLEKDLIERRSAILKAALIGFVEKRSLEGAAAIHVTSRREADEAAAFGFSLRRVTEIPNGVDVDRGVFRASPAVSRVIEQGPYVLFLGRINWKKGIDRLIESMPHAPGIRLIVAGNDEEGYTSEIESLATHRGLRERVIFTGSVYGDDKAALIARARALVLPSYSENFGNVVLEAMAAATPVVVSAEVGVADLVRQNRCGIVIDGGAEQLGRAIARVAADPDAASEMGRRGKAVAARYSWDSVAVQMEALYQSLQRPLQVLNQITPLILTYNEAPNLGRTLDRLAWARDIVIVDSLSTDDTRAIAARYPSVRVFDRAFTSHAEQWNFGLEQTGIKTDWVLALDADFVLTEDVIREIGALSPPQDVDGYRAPFTYCIEGTPLRSAVYPPVTVLYRRIRAKYQQDGHTQRVHVDGPVAELSSRILHDDRKSLAHWIGSQVKYMRLEAEKLLTTPSSSLGSVDRIRRWIVVAPPAMFLYCLFVRGGILDGWAGVYYALQRAAAELILSLSLAERFVIGRRHAGRPSSH